MKLCEIFADISTLSKEPTEKIMTLKKNAMEKAKLIDDEHQQIRDQVIADLYKAKTVSEISKASKIINQYLPKTKVIAGWS